MALLAHGNKLAFFSVPYAERQIGTFPQMLDMMHDDSSAVSALCFAYAAFVVIQPQDFPAQAEPLRPGIKRRFISCRQQRNKLPQAEL